MRQEKANDCAIVYVESSEIAEHQARELPAHIEEILKNECRRIAIVLDEKVEAHSEVVGLLIKCARRARDMGGQLAVVHPSEAFHEVIRICRLDRAIVFVRDLSALLSPSTPWPDLFPAPGIGETISVPVGKLGTRHVLLVDDHERLLESTREVLLFLSYRVSIAHDGQEAVDIFRRASSEIDVVLMDVSMPRKKGTEAFAEMLSIDPNARVVLMSGDFTEAEAQPLKKQGLKGFVRKPFTVSELQRQLDNAMR